MAQYASAKTCISISATLPATNTDTAYAALTWTLVGELESIGDIMTEHTSVPFKNLCTGKTSTLKGTENPIEVQITCALDRREAGQDLMRTARASPLPVAFKITEPYTGDFQYFKAFVMSEGAQYGDADSVIKTMFKLGLVTWATGETIIVKEGV
jgi:hypothetical protein